MTIEISVSKRIEYSVEETGLSVSFHQDGSIGIHKCNQFIELMDYDIEALFQMLKMYEKEKKS